MTSSTPAPGTLRTPRQTASTAPGVVGQLDHQLVDRHPGLALEHLEPDDVALHRADLGRHRAEDARGVGQPDAHPGQHGAQLGAQCVLVMRTTTRMVFSALPA